MGFGEIMILLMGRGGEVMGIMEIFGIFLFLFHLYFLNDLKKVYDGELNEFWEWDEISKCF